MERPRVRARLVWRWAIPYLQARRTSPLYPNRSVMPSQFSKSIKTSVAPQAPARI